VRLDGLPLVAPKAAFGRSFDDFQTRDGGVVEALQQEDEFRRGPAIRRDGAGHGHTRK